jgi:hypothetical protein
MFRLKFTGLDSLKTLDELQLNSQRLDSCPSIAPEMQQEYRSLHLSIRAFRSFAQL